MTLKNPYGLTLELGAAEALAHCDTFANDNFDTSALRAFSGEHTPPPFDLPIDDRCFNDETTSEAAAAAAASVRLRIRDSAVLRSEQVAGFATAADSDVTQPLVYEDEPEEPELPSEHESQGSSGELRLNFFVHNGYRYDGDIFELRPPQERSIASRPERVLPHKPAVLNHRQVFNRVYSEGTYNNRPSSLRQLRLSARLSAASWASVSEMLAASDEPPTVVHTTPAPPVVIPARGSARVSLLVESALVTEEQAKRIKVASPGAPPAQRAPRLTRHINKENDPNAAGNRAMVAAPLAEKRGAAGRRKKSRTNAQKEEDRLARVETITVKECKGSSRSVLSPSNTGRVDRGRSDPPSGVKMKSKKSHKSPARKKPFWKSFVHK